MTFLYSFYGRRLKIGLDLLAESRTEEEETEVFYEEPILEDRPTSKELSVSEPLLQTIEASDQPTASSNIPSPASPNVSSPFKKHFFFKPTEKKETKTCRRDRIPSVVSGKLAH